MPRGKRRRQSVAIAIDGPAASGKSSVARRLARRYGFIFVNSGAMYRAFTWWVLENGIDPADTPRVIDLLHRTAFTCGVRDLESTVAVDGRELTEAMLREDRVNRFVSPVSAIPEVRERLVEEQRRYCEMGDVVMEGRDIGTVVLSDSPYKFYLDATPEVRNRRREAQGITDNIRQRDRQDSSRKAAPLRVADDARVIDTSYLTLDEAVERIARILHDRGMRPPDRGADLDPMNPVYRACYLASQGWYHMLYGMQVHQAEKSHVPGGAYIASNHESFLDPPIIGTALDEPIHFLARKTLFKPPVMSWLLPRLNVVPVDRDNAELASLRLSIKLVKGGKKMLLFPEGTRSRDGLLQPARRGIGMLVAKSGVPVIPARIFGSYAIFPRTAKLPRLTGKLHVVFGDPIHFSPEELKAARGKDAQQAISDRIMAAIAALQHPEPG